MRHPQYGNPPRRFRCALAVASATSKMLNLHFIPVGGFVGSIAPQSPLHSAAPLMRSPMLRIDALRYAPDIVRSQPRTASLLGGNSVLRLPRKSPATLHCLLPLSCDRFCVVTLQQICYLLLSCRGWSRPAGSIGSCGGSYCRRASSNCGRQLHYDSGKSTATAVV